MDRNVGSMTGSVSVWSPTFLCFIQFQTPLFPGRDPPRSSTAHLKNPFLPEGPSKPVVGNIRGAKETKSSAKTIKWCVLPLYCTEGTHCV